MRVGVQMIGPEAANQLLPGFDLRFGARKVTPDECEALVKEAWDELCARTKDEVQEVARAVPDTPIVVLDGFSSFERAEEALRVADQSPNLVFDMSLAHGFGTIEHFIARHGPERVVFGTDVYSHVRADRNPVLEGMLQSKLDPAAKQAILAGTISRILGLPEPSQVQAQQQGVTT